MSGAGHVFSTERHGFVETVMERLGISWTVETVSVSDVDIRDGDLQTRHDVDQCSSAVAREYADKVKSGEAFPMVVLVEKSPGRFRVVCGRHRASAYSIAQNGKSSYAAYVVAKDTTRETLLALSARENNGNGVRQGNADTAKAAASVLMAMALPSGSRCQRAAVINGVADQFGANVTTIKDHYFARLVQREMINVGVPTADVPVTVMRRMWGWTSHADWREVAQAVAENGSLPNLYKLVAEAQKDKLDAKSLAAKIREFADTCAGKARPRVVIKDPASVTIEHLGLAYKDLRDLAAPRNLPDEQAEEIASMVEVIRVACKDWKSR